MCSWSVSRSSNFASFLEDIYIYLASLHFLNDLFPDDNYSNFSWRIDKLSSITFLLYQRLEIFRVLLADLLSWKELEGSEFKQRRPKYPFTKSRNSLRNFEPGMGIFFAFEITASSIDGTSFSSSYPSSVSGMKRHSLLILCYYLCTLFDMAALHFPWVGEHVRKLL